MAKYRKKPVVIEAVRWAGDNEGEVAELAGRVAVFRQGVCTINTLEGVMTANVGDWIIKGVQGELYPCKPDIFEATYEALDG